MSQIVVELLLNVWLLTVIPETWELRFILILQKTNVMGNNTDNKSLLDAGMKKAGEIVSDFIYNYLVKVCEALVDDAVKGKRGWSSFTGNTITSYACGLYINGRFSYYYSSGDKMAQPIRVKLTEDEYAYLSPDYDGKNRGLRGTMKTDGDYGEDFSLNFLKSYKPDCNDGFAIVMCTGTEYSTYLENRNNANVLTDTFQKAQNILFSNLKPMK